MAGICATKYAVKPTSPSDMPDNPMNATKIVFLLLRFGAWPMSCSVLEVSKLECVHFEILETLRI